MEYIVLDFEWNQGKEETRASLPFELIEIGAVKLDESRTPISSFRRVIRPVVYPKLFEYTKKLITLTEQDLQSGVPFSQAVEEFWQWIGEKEYRFCTWGTLDLTVFQQNISYFGFDVRMDNPLLYYDVQHLYMVAFERTKTQNLQSAVQELRLPVDRPFHGALDDATYTAKVFERINPSLVSQYPSIDYYRCPKRCAVSLQYPGERLTVSAGKQRREDVKADRRMSQIVCSVCGTKIKKTVPWFNGAARGYYCAGYCKQHGYTKGRLLIKTAASGEYFGVQVLHTATEEEEDHLRIRYKEKRRKKK